MVVVYGSSTGNCEDAAKHIAGAFMCDCIAAQDAGKEVIAGNEHLILGSSTWGIGEMQDDFSYFLEMLKDSDLTGKKISLFGTGDSESFADSFVDAIGEIFEVVTEKGAEVQGFVPDSIYEYSESRAVHDGNFVGLPLDYDNDGGGVETKINAWVQELQEAL